MNIPVPHQPAVDAATTIAVHVAYLTAAAADDANPQQLLTLQKEARVFLEKYEGVEPLPVAYMRYLAGVMGVTWTPKPKWQQVINQLKV